MIDKTVPMRTVQARSLNFSGFQSTILRFRGARRPGARASPA